MKITLWLCLILCTHSLLATEEQEMNITRVNLYETSTNRAFKVIVDGNPVFFRVGRDHPENIGINREKEIENYKFAEQLGLAPTLLGYHLKHGLLMTQFIEGLSPSHQRIREADMLDSVVTLLKKLHDNSAFEARLHEKTIFSINDAFLNTLTELGIEPEENEDIKKWLNCRKTFETGYYNDISMAICHGDLYRENILETKEGKVYFVDWEYSFYGYVIDDLGKFCATHWLNDEEIKYFAHAYWGSVDAEKMKKLQQNIFMQHMNFCLWSLIQAHHEPELAPFFREITGYAENQLNDFVAE